MQGSSSEIIPWDLYLKNWDMSSQNIQLEIALKSYKLEQIFSWGLWVFVYLSSISVTSYALLCLLVWSSVSLTKHVLAPASLEQPVTLSPWIPFSFLLKWRCEREYVEEIKEQKCFVIKGAPDKKYYRCLLHRFSFPWFWFLQVHFYFDSLR